MKKIINFILILLLTIFVLYFSLKGNFYEILNILIETKLIWIVIAYLFVLNYTFLKSLVTYDIIKKFKKIKVKKVFHLQLMTFFFNAITPFSSGGQPFQIFVLKKNGLSLSDGTNVIVQESLIHQLSVILLGLIAIILNIIFNICKLNTFLKLLILFGIVINLCILLLLFLMGYNKKMLKKITSFIIKIFKKYKDIDIKKINEIVENFNKNAKILLSNKKRFLKLILLNVLALLLFYSVPLFIFYSLNFSMNLFDVVVLNGLLNIIGGYIPLPGGLGGIEYLFITLFGMYIKNPLLTSSMLLWRFVTYYLPLIIGAIDFNIYKCKKGELN